MGDTLDLLAFVDALGWQIAGEGSLLSDVCPVRKPLRTALGYSCACVPTLLTGRSPAEHGHFAFWVYAPNASPFRPLSWLRYLPRALTGRARVRGLLSRAVAKALGYTGYFQLYNVPFELIDQLDYTEKRDLFQPGGIRSGDTTLLDDLAAQDVPVHVSDWRRPDHENLERLARDVSTGRPRFAFLYLGGLDAVLHRTGTESAEARARVAWYDVSLRRVLDRAAGAYRRVRLHVVSDHGMTDVTRFVDVTARLAAAGLTERTDYVAVLDSTMARLWFLTDRARARAAAALEGPDGRVLDEAELARLGCAFGDGRYGDLIWLAEAGAMVFPNHMGANPIAGMHGYHPDAAGSWASYLGTDEPAVPVRGLTDVRGLVSHAVLGSARPARIAKETL